MCSSVPKEFAPYFYTKLTQSTSATKAGMGNLHMLSGSVIPSACIVRFYVVKSNCVLCPDLCREIHPHALSGFMSRNPSARFVPIYVAKSNRALCPSKMVLEVDRYVVSVYIIILPMRVQPPFATSSLVWPANQVYFTNLALRLPAPALGYQ